MKSFKVTNRFNKVKTEDSRDIKKYIWGFEMVTLEVNFFGNIEEFDLDTFIMFDGTQIIKDGNGWIPSGTVIHSNMELKPFQILENN